MKYLAPNEQHQITVPVIVGAEYAIPIGDAKLATRLDGVTTRTTLIVEDATDITFTLDTPDVASGDLKLISVELTAPTEIGSFRYREIYGVVDTLDIPIDCDSVRALLGVTPDELNDSDINLEGKYVEVYKWLINNFHTLRQSDAYLTKKFGDLVAIIAAISAAPTLIIRLDKSRKTENGQFQRLTEHKYFQEFLNTLDDTLAGLKDDLEDFLETPEVITVSRLNFVTATQWSINN